jgi:hypothetical protein
MNQRELKAIERRTVRYHTSDGLYQMNAGLIFLLMGGQSVLIAALPRGSFRWSHFVASQILLIAASFGGLWVIQKIKARITYPLVGYARMQVTPEDNVRLVRAMVAAVVLGIVVTAGLAVLIVRDSVSDPGRLAPPVLALWVAMCMFIAWARERDPHLLWAPVMPVAAGFYLYAVNAGWKSFGWVVVCYGLSFLVLGALRLWRFLRENPKLAETEA